MSAAAGIRDAWHGVQFYDDDQQLCPSVSDYLAGGLEAGDTLIVVSTPQHWSTFSDRLWSKGHNVDDALSRGQLIRMDARETLSLLLRDGMPDERIFRATVEPLLIRSGGQCRTRIYGEMVDLLWKEENSRAALLLEGFWNNLHDSYPFWLLCGYQTAPVRDRSNGVHEICAVHTHVIRTRVGSAHCSSRSRAMRDEVDAE
jgi:hypothetical protein